MDTRSWFGIAVRLLGLWQVLEGLDEVVIMFGLGAGSYHSTLYSGPSGMFPFVVFHLIAGGVLLKLAPLFVMWCYPSRKENTDQARDDEIA
jgi:hypothetical protein